jgi:hypothetical protein
MSGRIHPDRAVGRDRDHRDVPRVPAKATSIFSKSDVIPGGETAMLVPILIDLLIGCSLMLLAGWAGDTLRYSARRGRRGVCFKEQADWTRMSHPWDPWS